MNISFLHLFVKVRNISKGGRKGFDNMELRLMTPTIDIVYKKHIVILKFGISVRKAVNQWVPHLPVAPAAEFLPADGANTTSPSA